MNQGARLALPPCHDRRERRESAHAEDRGSVVLVDERLALLQPAPHAQQEGTHLRRPRLGHCEERHLLELQRAMAAGRERVDLLLTDEERHLMAARLQDLSHRNAREQVAARAAAGDEDVPLLFSRISHER